MLRAGRAGHGKPISVRQDQGRGTGAEGRQGGGGQIGPDRQQERGGGEGVALPCNVQSTAAAKGRRGVLVASENPKEQEPL